MVKISIDHDTIILNNIPIPPSSNNQYRLFNRKGKTYHVPSHELKQFKDKMDQYPILYPQYHYENIALIQSWLKSRPELELKAYFFFKRNRIYTLKNTPKRMDVSNRLKALHDCVSKMLGIDDCVFFEVFAKKIPIDEGDEKVTVKISPCR